MFLMPEALVSRIRADIQRDFEREKARRLPLVVPWSDEIGWAPELNIQASTYKALSLFPVEPLDSNTVSVATAAQRIDSPDGRWVYVEKRMSNEQMLRTASGKRRGDVFFDGPIIIPGLYEKRYQDDNPWMSITPMEILTLRPGTKRAKGDVIIAGLGLGHQLIEVSKRKQVTRLTLIERDKGLVDWLLPRITPHLARPLDVIVIGDVFQELPKMAADVALLDVYPNFGGNRRPAWEKKCKNIKAFWTWGA